MTLKTSPLTEADVKLLETPDEELRMTNELVETRVQRDEWKAIAETRLAEIERLRLEVRALRIGHGFTDPDSLDAPAHEPGAVLEVARWQKAQEVMCHSFDGENRTHYLRAVGRESFTDTIDRLLRERNAVNLEDYGPVIDEVAPVSKEAWDALKSSGGG
jgi:hypothetical protein